MENEEIVLKIEGPASEDLKGTPDLLVTTHFSNLPLRRLIPRGQVTAVSEKTGVSVHVIHRFLNLSASPFKTGKGIGEYRDSCLRLAEYFSMPPDELFPRTLYSLKLPKKVSRAFRSAEILPMLEARNQGLLPSSTEEESTEEVFKSELSEEMLKSMNSLKPRRRKIVEMYFGLNGHEDKTFKEIAESIGISATRVRHIFLQGLRDLRHPSRSGQLRAYVGGLR